MAEPARVAFVDSAYVLASLLNAETVNERRGALSLEGGRMHKYRPLARYLERQASPDVELTFDEIEKIIGDVLPQSAFIHRAWWANCYEGRIHAPAWLDTGFMVDAVDLGGRNVRFHRKGIDSAL
jgi:hypothetical protein